MNDAHSILFGDQRLLLLPRRGLYWPERNTLFIADTHFGKSATFRAAAIPIPDGTAADLGRLDELLQQTGASRLVILGDLIHARRGRCETVFAEIAAWRARQASLEILLIRGNHDRAAGDPPDDWRITCLDEPFLDGPLALMHDPDPDSNHPSLAGHLHPKIKLGIGTDEIRCACFVRRGNCLIFPAFTSFADQRLIPTEPGDVVYPIAEDAVFEFPIEKLPRPRRTRRARAHRRDVRRKKLL